MTMYITPYRRMATLRNAMDRLFEESMVEAQDQREMVLALDVQANDESYDITALVPGLESDELELEIMNNTVTIRGEFKSTRIEDSKYLLSELPHGLFSRSITLPTAVDASKVEATINNGVLMLHVPKAEAHRPKTIKVAKA